MPLTRRPAPDRPVESCSTSGLASWLIHVCVCALSLAVACTRRLRFCDRDRVLILWFVFALCSMDCKRNGCASQYKFSGNSLTNSYSCTAYEVSLASLHVSFRPDLSSACARLLRLDLYFIQLVVGAGLACACACLAALRFVPRLHAASMLRHLRVSLSVPLHCIGSCMLSCLVFVDFSQRMNSVCVRISSLAKDTHL